MARLREEVNRWPISPERRATVLAGVGPPLWRAIERREVRTRGELASLVRALVYLLREAEGVSGDLRAACRYGQWAIRKALKRLPAVSVGSRWSPKAGPRKSDRGLLARPAGDK